MTYKFVCHECGKRVELSIPINEYKSTGHYCECGAELKRDINDFCTVSKRDVDGFFGVSTEK